MINIYFDYMKSVISQNLKAKILNIFLKLVVIFPGKINYSKNNRIIPNV